jgi:hypothetical protein
MSLINYIKENKSLPTNINDYDLTEIDGIGNTPAMCWIIYCKTFPRLILKHDPNYQNLEGLTIAMQSILYINSDPAKWMKHDLSLKYKNLSIAEFYILYAKNYNYIPKWMLKENMSVTEQILIEIAYMKRETNNYFPRNIISFKYDIDKFIYISYCIKYTHKDSPEYTHNIYESYLPKIGKLYIKYCHKFPEEWMMYDNNNYDILYKKHMIKLEKKIDNYEKFLRKDL